MYFYWLNLIVGVVAVLVLPFVLIWLLRWVKTAREIDQLKPLLPLTIAAILFAAIDNAAVAAEYKYKSDWWLTALLETAILLVSVGLAFLVVFRGRSRGNQ